MPRPPPTPDDPLTTAQLRTVVKMSAVVTDKPLDQLAGIAVYVINCLASVLLAESIEADKQ
jgi:hypothetical protein